MGLTRTTEHPVQPICEWTGGLVDYRLQDAGFGILLLVRRESDDNVHVSALDKDDGNAAEWVDLDPKQRTERAEHVLRRERGVLHAR